MLPLYILDCGGQAMFADGPLFLSLSGVWLPHGVIREKLNQPKQGDLSRISHQGTYSSGGKDAEFARLD